MRPPTGFPDPDADDAGRGQEAFRVNDGVAEMLLVEPDTPEQQRKAAVAHDRNMRLLTLVTDAMPEWTDDSPLTLPEALHRFWPFVR
jgi:hypothetical protein